MDHETEQALKQKYELAIRAMEKHLQKRPDGTIALDAKSADELRVDPGAFSHLQMSLQETNRKIKSGELKPNEISLKYDDPPKK